MLGGEGEVANILGDYSCDAIDDGCRIIPRHADRIQRMSRRKPCQPRKGLSALAFTATDGLPPVWVDVQHGFCRAPSLACPPSLVSGVFHAWVLSLFSLLFSSCDAARGVGLLSVLSVGVFVPSPVLLRAGTSVVPDGFRSLLGEPHVFVDNLRLTLFVVFVHRTLIF